MAEKKDGGDPFKAISAVKDSVSKAVSGAGKGAEHAREPQKAEGAKEAAKGEKAEGPKKEGGSQEGAADKLGIGRDDDRTQISREGKEQREKEGGSSAVSEIFKTFSEGLPSEAKDRVQNLAGAGLDALHGLADEGGEAAAGGLRMLQEKLDSAFGSSGLDGSKLKDGQEMKFGGSGAIEIPIPECPQVAGVFTGSKDIAVKKDGDDILATFINKGGEGVSVEGGEEIGFSKAGSSKDPNSPGAGLTGELTGLVGSDEKTQYRIDPNDPKERAAYETGFLANAAKSPLDILKPMSDMKDKIIDSTIAAPLQEVQKQVGEKFGIPEEMTKKLTDTELEALKFGSDAPMALAMGPMGMQNLTTHSMNTGLDKLQSSVMEPYEVEHTQGMSVTGQGAVKASFPGVNLSGAGNLEYGLEQGHRINSDNGHKEEFFGDRQTTALKANVAAKLFGGDAQVMGRLTQQDSVMRRRLVEDKETNEKYMELELRNTSITGKEGEDTKMTTKIKDPELMKAIASDPLALEKIGADDSHPLHGKLDEALKDKEIEKRKIYDYQSTGGKLSIGPWDVQALGYSQMSDKM
ncbi:MAG: hypothetical protein AB2L14_22020 [Candidatus Xenobiia bacterium LiM19]